MVCSDQFAVFIIIITNQNPYMFLPRLVTQSSFLSVLSVTTLFSFINQWEGQGICMPAVTCCCICIHCSKIRTVVRIGHRKENCILGLIVVFLASEVVSAKYIICILGCSS